MRSIIIFICTFVLILFLSGQAANPDDMYWSVQATTIKVRYRENDKLIEKFHNEYYLYYGNQETLEREKTLSEKRLFSCFYLIHPGPDVEMPFEAPHRWYIRIRLRGHRSPEPRALFDKEIWTLIPQKVKYVLDAFGVENPDLLLIWCDTFTGTIQVFFHPRYDEDQGYYLKMLDIVNTYFSESKISI